MKSWNWLTWKQTSDTEIEIKQRDNKSAPPRQYSDSVKSVPGRFSYSCIQHVIWITSAFKLPRNFTTKPRCTFLQLSCTEQNIWSLLVNLLPCFSTRSHCLLLLAVCSTVHVHSTCTVQDLWSCLTVLPLNCSCPLLLWPFDQVLHGKTFAVFFINCSYLSTFSQYTRCLCWF